MSHSSVKESDNYTMSPYATAHCVYIIILDITDNSRGVASLGRSFPFIDRTKSIDREGGEEIQMPFVCLPCLCHTRRWLWVAR